MKLKGAQEVGREFAARSNGMGPLGGKLKDAVSVDEEFAARSNEV